MKAHEIRELTDQELEHDIENSKRELLNLRIQHKIGQLENPAQLRTVRRRIAKLLTEDGARSKAKL